MSLRHSFTQLRQSKLARNTGSTFFGQGIRAALQGAYFVLIARAIGANGYGAFVGLTSLVAIAAPFATLGSGNILIKYVARDPTQFRVYWGNALFITQVSGMALALLVIPISQFVLPPSISPWPIIPVALADLVFWRLVEVSAQAFQSFERLGRTAQMYTLASLMKLIAVCSLIVIPCARSVTAWCWIYLLGTVCSAAVALWLVRRELGAACVALDRIRGDMMEGIHFSVSLSAQNIYNDVDKTMLSRFGTLAATGTYGAAYRLIDIAFLPVSSLLWASWTGFFRHGEGGIGASRNYARQFLPIVGYYGLAAGAGLYLTAPLIPIVVGRQYQETVLAVRWLCLLPLLKSLHYFAASILAGAGYQGLRSRIQVGMALLNVVVNFWLIPAYSWPGAAWSSLMTDGFLALFLWIAVFHLSSKMPHSTASKP